MNIDIPSVDVREGALVKVRLVALFAVLVLVAGACGSDGAEDGEGDAAPTGGATSSTASDGEAVDARTLPDEEIDREATVRMVMPFVATSLDPHLFDFQATGHQMLWDRVLRLSEDREVEPWLASAYEVSEDGLTVTLTAREGVTFNDGAPLDAEALKVSIDRARTLDGSSVKGGLGSIASTEVVDDMTLELRLSQPDSAVLFWLAATAVASPGPLEDGTDLSSDPQGANSTPYEVVEWNPSQSYVFERRDDVEYWEPDAFPVRRYEITAASDFTAHLNALATGQLDFALLRKSEAETRSALEGNGATVYVFESETMRSLSLRSSRAEFGSKEVRQAIAWALDRQSLIDSGALGVEATYPAQFIAPGAPGFIEGYDPWAYDPEKAQAAIEAAGGPFSFDVAILADSPPETASAAYMQQALEPLGITVEILPMELNQLLEQFVAGDLDAIIAGAGGNPDPTMQMTLTFLTQHASADPEGAVELQSMLDEANSLPLGTPERDEALQEVNRFVGDNTWSIPIYRQRQVIAANENLVGVANMAWTMAGATMDPTYFAMRK